MTEPNPRHDNLFSVVVDMEDDVRRIALLAQVLIVMSGSCHSVQPDTLAPIANALHELGVSLEAQYKRAFNLSRPQAKQTGGAHE